MDKQIPIYFESMVIDSPIQEISTSNPKVGRFKVRAFTKYGNRNGSYITEAVANQLIESAISGHTPVVGFFDPQTKSWASHTGPTLANAYGYVENFLGWEPFTDTDGVSRDYAVFSVILFTEYFEEATKILGQNQSMELDPKSITGDWALMGEEEYFVYKTAKILGFCVIGSHEPCFSVSAFFSKNDEEYKTQYEKFSSLLEELKAHVEETIQDTKGGEHSMNELEEKIEPETVEVAPEVKEEEVQEEEVVVEETPKEAEETPEEVEEPAAEPEIEETASTEFDTLTQQFNELQQSYNELEQKFNDAQAEIAELKQFQCDNTQELENLRSTNEKLQALVTSYETQAAEVEQSKKGALIDQYTNMLEEEEISPIREKMNDYSYNELESQLAIAFAHKQMNTGSDTKEKIPLPEPQESQFALLMKKYRKN